LAVLHLSEAQRQAIRAHAERAYPQECCGLLLGWRQAAEKQTCDLWPAQNAWDGEAARSFEGLRSSQALAAGKERHFSIAPREMVQAQKSARERQLDIIGVYHSHPEHPAVPSEFDRAIAWPEYSYPIVAVRDGRARELNGWVLAEDGTFVPEAIAAAGVAAAPDGSLS